MYQPAETETPKPEESDAAEQPTAASSDDSKEDETVAQAGETEVYAAAEEGLKAASQIYGIELLAGDVPLDEATFPDANFRAVLAEYDTDGSGGLSTSELRNIQDLDCSGKGIKSLQGIENLNRLQFLDCSNNQITNLDVGKSAYLLELDCSGNNMETLNVSNAIRLQELICTNNRLTSLDVSGNTKLEELYCDGNQLTSLTLGSADTLELVYCQDNQLASLDVSGLANLTGLQCSNNQHRPDPERIVKRA